MLSNRQSSSTDPEADCTLGELYEKEDNFRLALHHYLAASKSGFLQAQERLTSLAKKLQETVDGCEIAAVKDCEPNYVFGKMTCRFAFVVCEEKWYFANLLKATIQPIKNFAKILILRECMSMKLVQAKCIIRRLHDEELQKINFVGGGYPREDFRHSCDFILSAKAVPPSAYRMLPGDGRFVLLLSQVKEWRWDDGHNWLASLKLCFIDKLTSEIVDYHLTDARAKALVTTYNIKALREGDGRFRLLRALRQPNLDRINKFAGTELRASINFSDRLALLEDAAVIARECLAEKVREDLSVSIPENKEPDLSVDVEPAEEKEQPTIAAACDKVHTRCREIAASYSIFSRENKLKVLGELHEALSDLSYGYCSQAYLREKTVGDFIQAFLEKEQIIEDKKPIDVLSEALGVPVKVTTMTFFYIPIPIGIEKLVATSQTFIKDLIEEYKDTPMPDGLMCGASRAALR